MNLPPLEGDDWQLVTRLFHQAVEIPAASRMDWLRRHTEGKGQVREEVESLLRSHEEAEGFLEKPATPARWDSFFDGTVPLFSKGDTTGDFQIERILGSGSFGTVYLARQKSLDRKVALKVSPDLGDEARTMARLDHPNIVAVYSEEIRKEAHLRLVVMQYVSGTNLDTLMHSLPPEGASGQEWLNTLDQVGSGDALLDPLALRDRDLVSRLGPVEAVLWIGARLAAALAYAHERGILHLDIKPGNILMNGYGRPYLTDFNVSLSHTGPGGVKAALLGGTAHYMPPEQQQMLDTPRTQRRDGMVDARTDIYALGKVIGEMVERATGGAPWRHQIDVAHVIEKCIDPNPRNRYESAARLASALEGCLELRQMEQHLPRASTWVRLAQRYPGTALVAATLLPQLVGSVVNISYNGIRIVSFLTPEQKELFHWLVIAYNSVSYPLCLALMASKVFPLLPFLRRPHRTPQFRKGAAAGVRRQLLRFEVWLVVGITLGWMPGSVLFPLALDRLAGPLPLEAFGHFFVSFTLSWLIALTYSFLFTQFLLLRCFYPRLFVGEGNIQTTAGRELSVLRRSLGAFPYMAAVVPLAGSLLVIGLGNDTVHVAAFRSLLAYLITLGILGVGLALKGSRFLSQTVYALTGRSLETLRPRDP